MNVARLKTHFANWRDWELNPIVIKELRQSVRSWAVTGMLLMLLLLLFVVAMAVLVNQSLEVSVNEQLGGQLFRSFLVVLAGAGILFIPLYLGIRVAAERQDNNPDLLYISTLSPARIIRGKFFCGAYLALLFISACLPFMALTNLLRGVDLPTVFFLLTGLFLVICSVNLGAIFIACLPISKLLKILLSLAGFCFLFTVVGSVLTGAVFLMASGVGSMMFRREFWDAVVTFLTLIGAAGGLCYVLSVALISPPSANRALLPRLYLTVIWVLGALLAGYASVTTSQPDLILIWTFTTSLLLVAALVVTISNHDQLSLRVRRTIPRSGPLRLLAFFFYNGAAGGLLWIAGLSLVTYGGTVAWEYRYWGWSPSPGLPPSMGGRTTTDSLPDFIPVMAFYFFAYALFALFIHRRFLPRYAPKITGVLAIFITAITALGPNIVLFFLNQLSWQTAEHLQLGNAFNLMSQHDAVLLLCHLIFSLGLLLLAGLLNARWFFAQWQNFRPPAATPVPPPPPA
jgi:hypothetical protein